MLHWCRNTPCILVMQSRSSLISAFKLGDLLSAAPGRNARVPVGSSFHSYGRLQIAIQVAQSSGWLLPVLPLISARDWALPWNLGFEITQPRLERALVQVHFRDADGSRSTPCAHAG